MKFIKKLFLPFAVIDKKVLTIILWSQIGLILLWAQTYTSVLFPKPILIFEAFLNLFKQDWFYDALETSLLLTFKAMGIAILIAAFISYLYVLPFFNKLIGLIAKFRFLTIEGLFFVFAIFISAGGELKLDLLLFGIIPFFVTTYLSVINQIPDQQIHLARTLRFKPWQILYEIIIRGKLDQLFEVIRQNFSICWVMIVMVEGRNLGDGGIGASIYKYNRRIDELPNVLALQLVILLIGIGSDLILAYSRKTLFRYVK